MTSAPSSIDEHGAAPAPPPPGCPSRRPGSPRARSARRGGARGRPRASDRAPSAARAGCRRPARWRCRATRVARRARPRAAQHLALAGRAGRRRARASARRRPPGAISAVADGAAPGAPALSPRRAPRPRAGAGPGPDQTPDAPRRLASLRSGRRDAALEARPARRRAPASSAARSRCLAAPRFGSTRTSGSAEPHARRRSPGPARRWTPSEHGARPYRRRGSAGRRAAAARRPAATRRLERLERRRRVRAGGTRLDRRRSARQRHHADRAARVGAAPAGDQRDLGGERAQRRARPAPPGARAARGRAARPARAARVSLRRRRAVPGARAAAQHSIRKRARGEGACPRSAARCACPRRRRWASPGCARAGRAGRGRSSTAARRARTRRADLDQRLEPLALQLHRVEADVHQHLGAVRARTVTACGLSCMATISPSQGARSSPSVGSIATPSPACARRTPGPAPRPAAGTSRRSGATSASAPLMAPPAAPGARIEHPHRIEARAARSVKHRSCAAAARGQGAPRGSVVTPSSPPRAPAAGARPARRRTVPCCTSSSPRGVAAARSGSCSHRRRSGS